MKAACRQVAAVAVVSCFALLCWAANVDWSAGFGRACGIRDRIESALAEAGLASDDLRTHVASTKSLASVQDL